MFRKNKIALLICLLFFVTYSILSIVRHNHYGSLGFDLGISDQVVWQYSKLHPPITTVQYYPFTSLLTDHFELIYALLAPFYWIVSSPITLLVLQAFMVSFSGIPIYLLAKRKKLHKFIPFSLLISYLTFFGVQNALWFDVHSLSFAAAFLAWFIYFLDKKIIFWAIIFFVLAIICKEDVALLTGAISFVYLIKRRDKFSLSFFFMSLIYLFLIFYVYFPYFTTDGYRYQSKEGLFSDLSLSYLYDSEDKRNTIFYSLAWFGFLPLFSPLLLIPAFSDLLHYFLFSHVEATHGFFLHYRVTLAPLLVFPTIIAISKFRILNNKFMAIYILLTAMFFQYYFHLPLSYLAKQWFWTEPPSVKNINEIITHLPKDASVVSQNNITPHISQRDLIFTLWPEKKNFRKDSPCSQTTCDWFRWAGNPEYLIVDTATNWDIRHLLANREEYVKGLENLKRAGIIKKYKQKENAALYKIIKKP